MVVCEKNFVGSLASKRSHDLCALGQLKIVFMHKMLGNSANSAGIVDSELGSKTELEPRGTCAQMRT